MPTQVTVPRFAMMMLAAAAVGLTSACGHNPVSESWRAEHPVLKDASGMIGASNRADSAAASAHNETTLCDSPADAACVPQ